MGFGGLIMRSPWPGSLQTSKKYVKESKLGEGTYAVVYQGYHVDTKDVIAIKKIKLGQFKDGMDMSAIREVKFLHELIHPNVIRVMFASHFE
jgi:cyclin-dependent kinase 7